MHISLSLPLILSLVLAFPPLLHAKPSTKPPGKNAILLSNVHTLTLRSGRQTTGRRLPPTPQLTCTGPSRRICNLYQPETIRCVNDGHDYDEEDVQWTCTASLPPEFKLGSTDVVCEGYRDSEDKWVLKGSCAVEYRLLLTELGEERFGGMGMGFGSGFGPGWWSWLGNLLFFGLMLVPLGLVLFSLVLSCLGRRNAGGRRGWGGFGGGAGGGGGGGGPYPGPPPPYSRYPGGDWFGSASPSQGWRPGFWTGALGGASLGYEFARHQGQDRRGMARRFNDYYDPGEGSSRSSQPRFSSTTSSTGFGSTRRK